MSVTVYPATKVDDLVGGKYTKPSGGIPATDLATAAQTSLGKADTAYQKPGSGIPSTDLTAAAQAALASAGNAVTALPYLAASTTAVALTAGSCQPFNPTANITLPALPALSGLTVGTTFSYDNQSAFTITVPYASGDTTLSGATSQVSSLSGTVGLRVDVSASGARVWRITSHIRSDGSIRALIPAVGNSTGTVAAGDDPRFVAGAAGALFLAATYR